MTVRDAVTFLRGMSISCDHRTVLAGASIGIVRKSTRRSRALVSGVCGTEVKPEESSESLLNGDVTFDDETEPFGERYRDILGTPAKFKPGDDDGNMWAWDRPLEDRFKIPFLPPYDTVGSTGEPPGELAADEGAVTGRPIRPKDGRRSILPSASS